VHRLQLHYTLSRESSPARVRSPLIDLLQAVSTQGSISAAARSLGLSYRHVWGELKRWEDQLGDELLVWEKGQAARLSDFGTKLLWAERQAQARLTPQIEALRAELERSFAVAFDDSTQILTLYASHDDALGALREYALQLQPAPLHLDIRFTGSVDAIRALNEGRCMMAGFHTRETPAAGTLPAQVYKPLLRPGLHKIIGFAQRQQGLMVAPGNPLNLRNLADLATRRARFVNRPLGTGTRVLLNELLSQQGLAAQDIPGFDHTEPSHTAVAHAVASGRADAGMGIELAARREGLDFVLLIQESYHLVCLKSALTQPAVSTLLSLLREPQWQAQVQAMAGYQPCLSGQIRALSQVLPWWRFRGAKPRQ
jgi:putative molybdopterin biosynthesis protein